MATVSLCLIVKDEADFLEGCLEHVRDIVDETIVVIDSRTTDNSRAIAERLGAKCFDFKWKDDLSAMRNFAIEKASSNWILMLDADERISDIGKDTILDLANNMDHIVEDVIGFKLEQRTYEPKGKDAKVSINGDDLRKMFGGFKSSKPVRLFKNTKKIRFKNKTDGLVEDSIKDNGGKIIETDIVIHHFSALHGKKDIEKKSPSYAELIWQQLKKEPMNPGYNKQVAVAFMKKGMRSLALKYFYRALKADPKFPGLLADIAKCHLEMRHIVDAIKFFNMAVKVNKNDISSMNNLGFIYMNLNKTDIARKLFETALQLEPDNKFVKDNMKALEKKIKTNK